MTAVRESIKYETGATDVHTLADEALSAGRGVCQDFAHVLIGVCRLHGMPATVRQRLPLRPAGRGNGNSASHAWVDVWTAAGAGCSLDPTHDREQTDRYVRVGVGPRLRGRASDPRRLQGEGERGARGRRPVSEL